LLHAGVVGIFERYGCVAVRDGGSAIEGCGALVRGCGLARRGAQSVEGGDELALVGAGASLMASFTRRTLKVTTAPIFKSFSRMSAVEPRDPLLGKSLAPARHEASTTLDALGHLNPRMAFSEQQNQPRPVARLPPDHSDCWLAASVPYAPNSST
jgi:hypothetical protein